ncbi:unnamed protein product, partial [Staurois parvus]
PTTGLLHLDPISGTLAGEKLFECKVAREINQGLINADILLGSIDISKFFVKVIYEGLNFVEPLKFRVTSRTTECIVEMHKTHYTLISTPGHGSGEHGSVDQYNRNSFFLVMPMLRVRPPKKYKFKNHNGFTCGWSGKV